MKKRLLAAVMSLCMIVSLLPVSALAVETNTPTQDKPVTNTENNITVNKYVSGDAESGYQLTLEAYANDKITTSETTTPLDVVLVLDVSGSMDDSISSVEYEPVNDNWSYSDIEGRWKPTYYALIDGSYEQVQGITDGNKHNRKYYLAYGEDYALLPDRRMVPSLCRR